MRSSTAPRASGSRSRWKPRIQTRATAFLATPAHELRNPLAPIRNAARVLLTQDLPQSRQQWAAELIGENAAAHPQVVLLDLGMPDIDGFEVCRQLRATPWARALCIIALTGWGQADDRRPSPLDTGTQDGSLSQAAKGPRAGPCAQYLYEVPRINLRWNRRA
jgi:CheY-like chemotaxis protein